VPKSLAGERSNDSIGDAAASKKSPIKTGILIVRSPLDADGNRRCCHWSRSPSPSDFDLREAADGASWTLD